MESLSSVDPEPYDRNARIIHESNRQLETNAVNQLGYIGLHPDYIDGKNFGHENRFYVYKARKILEFVQNLIAFYESEAPDQTLQNSAKPPQDPNQLTINFDTSAD